MAFDYVAGVGVNSIDAIKFPELADKINESPHGVDVQDLIDVAAGVIAREKFVDWYDGFVARAGSSDEEES